MRRDGCLKSHYIHDFILHAFLSIYPLHVQYCASSWITFIIQTDDFYLTYHRCVLECQLILISTPSNNSQA